MTATRAILTIVLTSAAVIICTLVPIGQEALLLLAAIILHELGHITAAAICKVPMSCFFIGPLGIRLNYDFSAIHHVHTVIVCIAGSIVSLLSAVMVIFLKLDLTEAGLFFTLASITLGSVNLLPVKGLDGGTICESVLAMILPPDTAYRAAKSISAIFIILFWMLSIKTVFDGGLNLSMLALSVYLLYSAL